MEEILQVQSGSLADAVEEQLVKQIQQRKLKVGDSIPPETELAQQLGVSRTVIREALMRLRLLGLIETKRKTGAVISSPDILASLHKSMQPHILTQETLLDIFELRLVLEIGMADLLYARITKEDIAQLREIDEKACQWERPDTFEIKDEIAFHGKLYDITGNRTLKKFQDLLLPIFNYVHNSGLINDMTPGLNYVKHSMLIDMLEHGDAALFRVGMRNHLQSHFMRVMNK